MRYYKIHQGPQNTYAKLAVEQGFVGIGYNMPDMSQINLADPEIKDVLRNLYIENHPNIAKQAVASGSGAVLRFLTVLQNGDVLLVPLGDGTYKVGELTGDYYYAGSDQVIPHRRNVRWYATLDKEKFSQALKNTLGSIGTIADITHQSTEIEALLSGDEIRVESIQSSVDQSEFALEKHLEDFLVENWKNTEFGKDYNLFIDEDGEISAQQYQTEVGPLDIIAIKKDKSEILILELKKGRSGDAVVGQMLRYITAIKKEVAEPNQKIRAVILTGQDDKKIRYSLEPLNGLIEFMVYKISFSINKVILPMPNPLQNKTLESILNELVAYYGWETLGQDIKIKCFTTDPSIKSSLTFLRKTPWARTKVEDLYIATVEQERSKEASK